MKRFGLLAIVIVGLFVIGCCPGDKPCDTCGGEKPGPPAAEDAEAKPGGAATETGEPAAEKDASATEEPAPGEGDTSATEGETEAPPTDPDPAGLMEPEVGDSGPALGGPENAPDTSP